jgi:hypothetical protein
MEEKSAAALSGMSMTIPEATVNATASGIDIGVCSRQEAEAFADDAGSRPSRLLRAGRGRRGGGEAEECRRCEERA